MAELSAYELLVVHVTPLEISDTVLLGTRYEEAERSSNRVRYTVYGRPGEKMAVPIVGAARPREVLCDGQAISPKIIPQGIELPLTMTGTRQTCQIEGGKLTTRETVKGWIISGNCVTSVPEGTRATIHLLWAHPDALHPPAATFSDSPFHLINDGTEKAALRRQAEKLCAVKPRCSATVNGTPVNVAAYDSKLYRPENVGDHRMYAEYLSAPWVWFKFDVSAGQSEITVVIEYPKGDAPPVPVEVGWWLWAENPLQKRTLTLSYDSPLPVAQTEPLPMAVRQDRQRQILTLQPVAALSLGEAAAPAVDGRTIKKDWRWALTGIDRGQGYDALYPLHAFDGDLETYHLTWGPHKDVDTFTIVLRKADTFDHVKAITGLANGDHILREGVLEASSGYGRWKEVARFKKGVAEAKLDGTLLVAVRIRSTINQSPFDLLAVREIILEKNGQSTLKDILPVERLRLPTATPK